MIELIDKNNDIEKLKKVYIKFCDYDLDLEKLKDNIISFLVFKDKGEIISFLEYSNYYERSEINNLYVEEEYRKNGIASKLIDKYIEILKESNIDSITLEVNEHNIAAINLYKKKGFKEVASRKNYYGNSDAILMMKVLR